MSEDDSESCSSEDDSYYSLDDEDYEDEYYSHPSLIPTQVRVRISV